MHVFNRVHILKTVYLVAFDNACPSRYIVTLCHGLRKVFGVTWDHPYFQQKVRVTWIWFQVWSTLIRNGIAHLSIYYTRLGSTFELFDVNFIHGHWQINCLFSIQKIPPLKRLLPQSWIVTHMSNNKDCNYLRL